MSHLLDETHADFLRSPHTEKLRGIANDPSFSKKNILLFAFVPNNPYDLFFNIEKCTAFLDSKKTTSFQGKQYDLGAWTGRSFHHDELVAYKTEKNDGLIDSFNLIRADGGCEYAECINYVPPKAKYAQLNIGRTVLKLFQFLDFVSSLNQSHGFGVHGMLHLCLKNADKVTGYNNTKQPELDYLRQDDQWMCCLKSLKISSEYRPNEYSIPRVVAGKLANAFGEEKAGCYGPYGEFLYESFV